ncbi:lariat debranching enzyme-like, partial [Tropilaelaps mercedesae]
RMHVAVVGCGHGELEKVYGALGRLEASAGFRVDVLLICGDFQAVRNKHDLLSMAVPDKFRQMCDFHRYYSGELKAPVLTVVIGGNHEASAYMDELRFGGWLAPSIFYLGTAGCVRIGDLRLAGLSGIYKGHDYLKGRFEKVPYDKQTVRSTYHIRALDVSRLVALRNIDVVMSHDWPQGICEFGDEEWLRRKKPFFNEDLDSGRLGSPPTRKVLDIVRPGYWFAAHLHVKFAALVPHEDGSKTRFLALDKCLPNRDFLQVIEMPGKAGPLRYDAEWLCILRKTRHLESTSQCNSYALPVEGELVVSEEEIDALIEEWQSDLRVPENFAQTAPPFLADAPPGPVTMYENPQTIAFLQKLGYTKDTSRSDRIQLSDFIADSSQARSKDEDKRDSQEQAESARADSPASGEDQKPLSGQTPTGRTIKRRNASMYNTE